MSALTALLAPALRVGLTVQYAATQLTANALSTGSGGATQAHSDLEGRARRQGHISATVRAACRLLEGRGESP